MGLSPAVPRAHNVASETSCVERSGTHAVACRWQGYLKDCALDLIEHAMRILLDHLYAGMRVCAVITRGALPSSVANAFFPDIASKVLLVPPETIVRTSRQLSKRPSSCSVLRPQGICPFQLFRT